MPIRFLGHAAPKAATPGHLENAAVLRDGVLLAEWYILRRLDEELRRARRYDRPLSVIVAFPVLAPGHRPTAVQLEVAAAAALTAARSTDLLGWLGGYRILMILPETGPDPARAAVFRWRSEMYQRALPVQGQKWQTVAIGTPCSFETAADLLDAAAERLGEDDAG